MRLEAVVSGSAGARADGDEEAVREGAGAWRRWITRREERAAEGRARRRGAAPGGCGPRDEEHVEGVGVADAVVEGAADDSAAAPELCNLRACASRTVMNDDVMIIASSRTRSSNRTFMNDDVTLASTYMFV